MTTNETIDDTEKALEGSPNKDMNIKISYQIDTSVDFLDVIIVNENGWLRTTVYHKPVAEPYILPYTSDYQRHVTSKYTLQCTFACRSGQFQCIGF